MYLVKTGMNNMKYKLVFGWLCTLVATSLYAQTDSLNPNRVTIIKDSRLDELAKKEQAFNERASLPRTAKGYRLMVLNSSDRNFAMKVRTQLLQRYPEQKVYMSFQPPNIKLKFGNFLEKEEAENYRKEILKNKLVTNNVYVVPETIEIKPEKAKDKDKEAGR
jgi:hypothetical protein